MQNIITFHLFILEIQSISESSDKSDHAHFRQCPPKKILINFICELVSTCKKSGYFIDLFWRYGWLKNPAIWLAENILAHISGTKIFPNIGFVQEHSWPNFSINSKNPVFGPFSQILGQKRFSPKIRLCHAQLHMGF